MKYNPLKLFVLILLSMILMSCSTFTIDGENGEKTKINLKDLKDGNMNINVEDEDGEESDINFESDEEGNMTMEMDTEDGTFKSETGEGTKLPEDFPKDFPLPKSSELVSATTMVDEDIMSYSVMFTFEENHEEVYNKIKDYAESKGLENYLENKSESDGNIHYMLGVGDSTDEAEGFLFNMMIDEEAMGSVTYNLPNE